MDAFASLVEEQKSKDGVAHLFGVILYTDRHPHIKKVLRDDDYWLALHELTGDNFAVFSVRPEKGGYEFPKMPRGFAGMMIKMWKEPSDNKGLIDLFEIKSTEDLPVLLMFAEVGGQYLSIQFKIDDSSESVAYNSIESHLKFACGVISNIRLENYNNPEGLFAALSLQDANRKKWRAIKSGVDIYSRLKGLLPF